MISVGERPAEVDDRAVPGWADDLVIVKQDHTAIGTLVEGRLFDTAAAS